MTTYPKIKMVESLSQLRLRVCFDTGEVKIYDCQPLLGDEAFRDLRNEAFFKNVQVDRSGYGIFWNDDVDLSESELWLNGVSEN